MTLPAMTGLFASTPMSPPPLIVKTSKHTEIGKIRSSPALLGKQRRCAGSVLFPLAGERIRGVGSSSVGIFFVTLRYRIVKPLCNHDETFNS